jgi:hypothetical protein
MPNRNTIRITKKTFYTSIAILILIIALLAYFFIIQPQVAEAKELQIYKKALYDSTLCQYACPLEEQFFQGKDQILPTKECVDTCIADLAAMNLNPNKFSNTDLAEDALVSSIEQTIVNCREESKLNETEIDNEAFFTCSADGLSSLKDQYPYLD